MADFHEIAFETELCEYLAKHDWLYSANDKGYDKERALFPGDVIGWLEDTQPDELAKVVKPGPHEEKQRSQLLDRLTKVLDSPIANGGGTINVLRGGFQSAPARFAMSEPKPESTKNPATVKRHEQVRLRVMRQVHFSTADTRSIDLVFFVNGIPVATAELKTDYTQSVAEAIRQYKKDRLPKDKGTGHVQPLLGFGNRAVVHFALSNDEVWMTTRLAGDDTHFLPFNMGCGGGKGNPPNRHGSETSYLWERVLQREAWLNILHRFVLVEEQGIVFPRFHQWEAVTKLVETTAAEGPGHRYLIQHSAGSGKTKSIAWTAHRLARLQVDNVPVFDSVIVVTDRNVLDSQLQAAIRQIDRKTGFVATIDADTARREGGSKSNLLAKTLQDGKRIIVVTIQTFPYAMNEIRKSKGLKGKKFAVIADEAHSSQSGQVAANLKRVLSAEELQEIENGGAIDIEAVLAAEASERASSENISYYAFTATPKGKTLDMFGRKPDPDDPESLPEPFHVYSMQQAIEEDYILDVLAGYHSYRTAFQIAEKVKGATQVKEVEQSEATKQVMRWVKLNPQTINQKAAVIVEHFHDNVAHILEGHAKAMIVADSRKAAVRYKFEVDKYIAVKSAKDPTYAFRTLVAFSGAVDDPEYGPEPFTDANLNPGVYDLAKTFHGDDYKIMIVANKFQTGFDEQLLCAMYVDKQLSGVTAVQTLSRLNRTHRRPSGLTKTIEDIFILDFVNEPAEIRKAFEPYFTTAFLETSTDPNLAYDISNKLDQAGIFTSEEVDKAAEAYVKGGHEALRAVTGAAKKRFAQRYNAAIADDDRAARDELDMFRKDVGSFVRVYDFMSQVIDYGDVELEKRAIFLRLLEREIRGTNYTAPIDLSDLTLKNVRTLDKGKTDLSLGKDRVGLKGVTAAGSGTKRDPKLVAMQAVIDRLNDLFGDEDLVEDNNASFVEALLRTLLSDQALLQQAKANTPKQFAESPDLWDSVLAAVADNQGAHNKRAEYFYGEGAEVGHIIRDIAWMVYEYATQPEVSESAP
ncbi:DEAD/DEAH box helicase family protein [Mycolicibacterium sp. ND9-15]|uniref:type I restriction endonuclease subunit R n=1 Tax=Mycolicibacterium sp. ND9-15 TaxID=3042320 RepID=UPI002DDAD5F1|nr:DEAD/DEAH box helicase family protein [Mycolicibacterium sp. ND9-15]WSE57123.1 DEAD/DEAH box helicase family protein [Mycolicibacterium sp. ND9-15]